MKLKLAMLLAVLITPLAPAAYADNEKGFYAGAGVGRFNAGIDDISGVSPAFQSWEEDDTAYKAFVGWRFSEIIALEAAYINLGEPSGEVTPGINVDASVDGFAPYVVATIPLGLFEVYGRLGYFFYDGNIGVESGVGGRVEVDEESEDFVYGAGVGLDLLDHINIRLEYERFDLQGIDDADALWLTGAWRF
jgi:opacity protein-like surface antigen